MFTTGLKNDIPLYDIAIGEILDFIVEHYFLLRHSGVSSASKLGKLSINAPLIRSLIRNGNVGERFLHVDGTKSLVACVNCFAHL